ncbi:MAG TPA: hypothetical protein VL426_03185 [Candidatus Binatia bacterium]|jgi:DNA integrity scanning protein DisA with diadenylate cyclase activity|nr:hypothetical protein [Candidatus Binatia bacterium]
MESKIKERLEAFACGLAESRVDIDPELKLRTAEMILRVMARKKKHFGLFVILGWQRKWKDHLDISDGDQDIFDGRRLDIMRGDVAGKDMASTVDFDGAILIDRHGVVVHSGVFIEGLRPRVVAQKLNPGRFADLSEQFGFETKVHARHLSAITASYVFKGTTVYTVSEENDAFHIFEGGRILHRCC